MTRHVPWTHEGDYPEPPVVIFDPGYLYGDHLKKKRRRWWRRTA